MCLSTLLALPTRLLVAKCRRFRQQLLPIRLCGAGSGSNKKADLWCSLLDVCECQKCNPGIGGAVLSDSELDPAVAWFLFYWISLNCQGSYAEITIQIGRLVVLTV